MLWATFLVYQQGADAGGTLAIGAVTQQQQMLKNECEAKQPTNKPPVVVVETVNE